MVKEAQHELFEVKISKMCKSMFHIHKIYVIYKIMIRYPSSCFAIYVCITRLSEVWEVNMYSYTVMYALVTYMYGCICTLIVILVCMHHVMCAYQYQEYCIIIHIKMKLYMNIQLTMIILMNQFIVMMWVVTS